MGLNESPTVAFGALSAKAIVPACYERIRTYYRFVRASGLLARWRKSVAMSVGASVDTGGVSWKILEGGEQGEIKRSVENHYRAAGDHKLQITTAKRPAIQCAAANSDKKSLEQTALGDGLVEYHLTDRGLERLIKQSAKKAVYQGEGFIEGCWDTHSGEDVAPDTEQLTESLDNPEAPAPKVVKSGEPKFYCLGPLDVVRDPYATSWTEAASRWVITRRWVSKFDLAAQYPEMATKLVSLAFNQSADECLRLNLDRDASGGETDLVPLWTLHHLPTMAVPGGRLVIFASEDAVLFEGAYPYRSLALAREAPDEMEETPFGFTPMIDLLGPQDALNAADTSIITNQNLRGNGNLKTDDPDVDVQAVAGFGNIVKIKKGSTLEPLEFAGTPSEFFAYKAEKKEAMASLIGSNSVAMGTPSEALSGDSSGAKMALFVETAMQNNSGFEQSHVDLNRDVALLVIHLYRDFGGSYERKVKIAGKSKGYLVKSFVADDLADIDRVKVDVGNPQLRTSTGRMAIADKAIELGMIKPGELDKYLHVLKEGTAEPLLEAKQAQLLRIRGENEALMEGKETHRALLSDPHWLEIPEHLSLLDNPALREPTPENEMVQAAVTFAVQEHIDLFKAMPPWMVLMRGGPEALAMWQQIAMMLAPPVPPDGTQPPAPGEESGTAPPPPGPADSTQEGLPGQPNLPTSPLTGQETTLGAPPPGALQ